MTFREMPVETFEEKMRKMPIPDRGCQNCKWLNRKLSDDMSELAHESYYKCTWWLHNKPSLPAFNWAQLNWPYREAQLLITKKQVDGPHIDAEVNLCPTFSQKD